MPEVSDSSVEVNGQFPVVGIGASAGGIEAVMELLRNLPPDNGMAYFYIQHLDPTHQSNLVSILARETKMPVIEGNDGVRIIPNHIYVLPPNKLMSVKDHCINIEPRPLKPHSNLPINYFFESLAQEYKEAAVGIVLSGTASDGTFGLKAIKLEGGITFAQNESAKFQSMPKNAIAEGSVDLVLSPAEIANELTKLAQQKDFYFNALEELKEDSTKTVDEHLIGILHLLHRSSGVDFSQYKINTIKRRIIRRMMIYKLPTLKEYGDYLKQHANEIDRLYQDLLINVTSFFRDPELSDHVRNYLLPAIIKSKTSNDPIRIWVAACSTGQEAYSLAILLIEALGENSANTPIQIFATDLSEVAINKARVGIYTQDEIGGIPPNILQRFFIKMEGSYRIVKSIRDLCVFATHNIAKDPPFSRLDIISCCNLLIYLDNYLQKKIIATFHYSLNNNGYLILGKSETVGSSSYLFFHADKKFKVYTKKKDVAAKAVFEMNYKLPETEKLPAMTKKTLTHKLKGDEADLEKTVDNFLLKKYTPATVIVNYDLDILQFRGSIGLFLDPMPGKASLNLLKMARQGLGFELRNIIHKARKLHEPVKKSGLEITDAGKTKRVSIEAIPLKMDTEDEYFMVVFEEVPLIILDPEEAGNVKDRKVKLLEAELNALREDMRSIVEAQEAANEELQSANEEIVSSNEELQSINEELETSKEEIESSNEELMTINQELQVRNEQLAEVQDYSESVFTVLRESLVILDKDLRVKNANSVFFKTFNVREDEVLGRMLYELNNWYWDIPKLRETLDEVINNNSSYAGLEITHYFPGIGEKVFVINMRKVVQKVRNRDLILLAIEDISEHRQGQRLILEREAWFRNMADNAPVMIWVTDTTKRFTFFNRTWLEFRGTTLEEEVNKNWLDGVHPDDLGAFMVQFDQAFVEKKPLNIKHRLLCSDGEYKWMHSKAKPGYNPDGIFTGYIGSTIESTP